MNNRGQGTTEYLIILAIVIVIALVVVGVLGGFPSLGSGISAGQSKSYWGGTQPLAFSDWSIGGTTGTFVVKNLTTGTITLTDLNWNGSSVTLTDVNIGPGSTVTVTDTDLTCGVGGGQTFSRTLGFTYDTPNISGIKFNGVQAIVGQCQ
ncbi:MAG: hypothetical protein AABX02_00230 [archaeon]